MCTYRHGTVVYQVPIIVLCFGDCVVLSAKHRRNANGRWPSTDRLPESTLRGSCSRRNHLEWWIHDDILESLQGWPIFYSGSPFRGFSIKANNRGKLDNFTSGISRGQSTIRSAKRRPRF